MKNESVLNCKRRHCETVSVVLFSPIHSYVPMYVCAWNLIFNNKQTRKKNQEEEEIKQKTARKKPHNRIEFILRRRKGKHARHNCMGIAKDTQIQIQCSYRYIYHCSRTVIASFTLGNTFQPDTDNFLMCIEYNWKAKCSKQSRVRRKQHKLNYNFNYEPLKAEEKPRCAILVGVDR